MSANKKTGAAIIALENKLKKARLLNYILSALCAVLVIVCIVLIIATSSCGTGHDLPLTSEASSSDTASLPDFTGTYQYVSNDYGFALEFTDDGAVWFYEATKDEALMQGFVGELIKGSEVSASDSSEGYYIPLYYVDFAPYTTAHIDISHTADGNITVTQFDESAPLSQYIPFGESVTLSPVENYSLSQVIVNLYSDQMTE